MKWAEVAWQEPEKYPAMKNMKCDGCGYPITAAWADLETSTFTLMADSPQAPGKFMPVEDCPGCGHKLAMYSMDLADEGDWHYVK